MLVIQTMDDEVHFHIASAEQVRWASSVIIHELDGHECWGDVSHEEAAHRRALLRADIDRLPDPAEDDVTALVPLDGFRVGKMPEGLLLQAVGGGVVKDYVLDPICAVELAGAFDAMLQEGSRILQSGTRH